MAYSIKLQTPDGSTETFECDADTIILDANGDIRIDSATGLIRFQDSTVDSIVFNAQNGVGQITASGNVSSSGEIIAASGSFEIIHGGTF